MMEREKRREATGARWAIEPVAVGLAALIVYLLLAPRVSGDGDGSEFTLVLATGGVAHPTGYPLYVAAGHLFCRILHAAGAPWPYAANAWSAAGAALAIGFLYALARELASPAPGRAAVSRSVAAFAPVLLFAFNPIWTNEAMLAEVYSWHVAWAAGTARLFLSMVRRIVEPAPQAAGRSNLGVPALAWGLVCGVGVAHHLTSVLVSVPLSIALVVLSARRGRLRPSLAACAAAGALVPLTAYGLIAWRAWHPALVQWPLLGPSMESVFQHLTGEQYRHFLGYFAPAPPQQELLARAGYPPLVAGIAALLAGALRARGAGPRTAGWGLFAAAALVTGCTLRYGVPDPAPYFLPALALGAAAMAPFVAGFLDRVGRRGAALAGAAILGVAVLAGPLLLWGRETRDRRSEITAYEPFIRVMWSAVPPDSAIVFWPDDRYMRLKEYQILRGEKPALDIENPEVIVNDLPRRKFMARYGIDPLRGLAIPNLIPGAPGEEQAATRFLVQVVRNVTDQSRLPVILFDPSQPAVRRLTRSQPPDGGAGGGGPKGPDRR